MKYLFFKGLIIISIILINCKIHGSNNENFLSVFNVPDTSVQISDFHANVFPNGSFANFAIYFKGDDKVPFSIQFHRNGMLKRYRIDFTKDTIYEFQFLKNGRIKRKTELYDNQFILYDSLFYPNGQLNQVSIRNSDTSYIHSYYSDGKDLSYGGGLFNARQGIWKYYYPNGQIRMITPYNDSLPDHPTGEWKSYNEKGELMEFWDFSHIPPQKTIRDYYPKLVKDCERDTSIFKGLYFAVGRFWDPKRRKPPGEEQYVYNVDTIVTIQNLLNIYKNNDTINININRNYKNQRWVGGFDFEGFDGEKWKIIEVNSRRFANGTMQGTYLNYVKEISIDLNEFKDKLRYQKYRVGLRLYLNVNRSTVYRVFPNEFRIE